MELKDISEKEDFRCSLEVPIVAMFGPSGAGKSTIIRTLLERNPGVFETVPIITTRPLRPGETGGERRRLSEEKFLARLEQGELCFVGQYYGFWVGAERTMLRELAQSGKVLLFDPNQFERVDAIKKMFPNSRPIVFSFLPGTREKLNMMDDLELRDLFAGRLETRIGTAPDEVARRLAECISTTRKIMQLQPEQMVFNDFLIPFDDRYGEIELIIFERLRRYGIKLAQEGGIAY